MSVATSIPALAADGLVVDTQPVVQNFNPDGSVSGATIGRSRLTRRADGLAANVQVKGLIPGGVYTFWWVAIPVGGSFPDDAFVAYGDSAVVGNSGRLGANMAATTGQSSIEGFLIGFQPLDFDLLTAEIHVEIAYHGLATDAGDDLRDWLSDFWTGTTCPESAFQNVTGQPHCPVYIVAIH